ncbi:MAG: haloacid dehalogenase type II [Acidimicrobiaceae bacterium]|nr:haloacid dehalogenase type II [Acidimicrobiaceae bacterium]
MTAQARTPGSPEVADIAAIVFDTFGTVVDWRSGVTRELSAWSHERDLQADWAAIADDWRARYAPSLQKVRDGTLGWTILDDLHRQSLLEVAHTAGLPSLSPADLDRLVGAWHRLDPWPDAVPGLTRLRARYLVGPLSNGNTSLLVDLARHGGLPWDVVLGSDVYLHYKPDPEVYLGFCRYFRLAPGQVMLGAAHAADLDAARALGLHTAYIPRPLEHGPDRPFEPADGAWDITASDIEDLAARMGT